MRKIAIAPSLLAANFAHLEADVQQVMDAKAEYLHYDIMDGHFVPNLSFGIPVVSAITAKFKVIHDVHLMIENPANYFSAFKQAGANLITFHYEVGKNIETMTSWIEQLHRLGVKAGISVKPATPIEVLSPLLKMVDLVLVMSVEPGFGGQAFLPSALNKIRWLRNQIDQGKLSTLIEVDGGINEITGKQCREAGVDILVAGSYLFSGKNLAEAMEKLRRG